jgi:hypothetical protein
MNDESNIGDPSTEVRVLPLASLVANRQQAAMFDPLPAAEFKARVADIKRRGLLQPIEAVPIGNDLYEILDGHGRKLACEVLGITEVRVLIRHDLAAAGEPRQEAEFLKANFMRRQMDVVQRVRVAARLYEVEHCNGRRLSGTELQTARDAIGQLVGLSGRSVSRYLRLARAPLAVQRAVSCSLLPLVVGERVADLPAAARDAVAARLDGVDDRREVHRIVREYVGGGGDGRRHKVRDALHVFVRDLDAGLHDLEHRAGEVPAKAVGPHLPTLRRAGRLITTLVTAGTAVPPIGPTGTTPCKP